jgi:hypothetical protein
LSPLRRDFDLSRIGFDSYGGPIGACFMCFGEDTPQFVGTNSTMRTLVGLSVGLLAAIAPGGWF